MHTNHGFSKGNANNPGDMEIRKTGEGNHKITQAIINPEREIASDSKCCSCQCERAGRSSFDPAPGAKISSVSCLCVCVCVAVGSSNGLIGRALIRHQAQKKIYKHTIDGLLMSVSLSIWSGFKAETKKSHNGKRSKLRSPRHRALKKYTGAWSQTTAATAGLAYSRRWWGKPSG